MKTRMLVAAALVAAVAGAHAVAAAQTPRSWAGIGGPRAGMHRGPGPDLGLRGVQLTESQREQVRSIMATHRAEFAELRTKLAEARRGFAEAARAAAVDEAAIRTHSTTVATAMADDAILRARIRAEVQALLTAEQQQQLQDREAQMQKRMQERQERLKQRRPPQ
jgi:Spy/CpxP family protein refolding chaperone